jgi:hypothetical protein
MKEIQQEQIKLAHSSDENRASRLFIMKNIMLVYVIVVITLALSILVGGFYSGDWAATTRSLTEIATTFVLPVVTLVLGYYFGREGREQARD